MPAANCPTPGKRGWPTRAAAEQALSAIWAKGFKRGPGVMPTRSYRCACNSWHLTSRGAR